MPLPNKLKRTIKKFARRDGKISKKFFPYDEKAGDLKLYFLKTNGRGQKFDILAVIDKWGVDWDERFRKQVFRVSTTLNNFGLSNNETFYEVVLKSDYVAKNGELYRLDDGDGNQIYEFNFAYHISATLEAQNTFSLADTVPEIP